MQLGFSMFLTNELKQYYLNDFRELSNYNDDEFWNLDPETKSHLTAINKNPHVNTLYSRRFNGGDIDSSSYIYITYTSNVEDNLKVLIEKLHAEFQYQCKVNFKHNEPRDNLMYLKKIHDR